MRPFHHDDSGSRSQPLWETSSIPSLPLEGAITADAVILGGGFTGLAAAYFFKRAEPSSRVVVLERDQVGSGASTRSAGIASTHFGLGLRTDALLFGRARALQGHAYAVQAVELVERLVLQHRIDCGYERTGLLRVATSRQTARRLERDVRFALDLGVRGIDWLAPEEARARVGAQVEGAWWEPRCAMLDPARLLAGLRHAVEEMGVQIYESTPAIGIQRRLGRIFVKTPRGGVLADKAGLAANAWSGSFAPLKRRQMPAFVHAFVTEPLSVEQFARLGWRKRSGVEVARRLPFFVRRTPDHRLLVMGDLGLGLGRTLDGPPSHSILEALQEDLRRLFPALPPLRIARAWHGAVSIGTGGTPALGFAGSERLVYAFGCNGHGLALAHMNGWTMSDLMRGEHTERTELFFVNRRLWPLPPEPLRLGLAMAARGLLRVSDALSEAPLPQSVQAEPPVRTSEVELVRVRPRIGSATDTGQMAAGATP